MASRPFRLRRLLFGDPLATSMAKHERISKIKALAVFSSDALSSVAYATEEILFVLILAGSAGTQLAIPIAMGIALLLYIVGTSYYQTIHAYPSGGGSYIVSKENLGTLPGLIAGAALMIDYVLTVAVSVAAGVSALYSAIPSLLPYRVTIGLLAIVIITVINLRGVRESASVFAVPTYIFIASIVALILTGLYRYFTGSLLPVPSVEIAGAELQTVQAVGLFLVMRGFSAGCTALTGVEAISNGIPAFNPPESDNAGKTLIAMIAILSSMFLGITFLAHQIGALPIEGGETVLSQIGRAVFGNGLGHLIIQAATALILFLAANTSYADFPRLGSLIARDGYLPRQLSNMGDRLVFSNGIIALGALASLLLVLFNGDTHGLLPLYAVGVFLSFTLSQAGMVLRWKRIKGEHWQRSLMVNAVGAISTFIVLVVIVVTRFSHGAWIVIVLIPIFVAMFMTIHRHYQQVAGQLSLENFGAPPAIMRHRVVVPIGGVHRGTLQALHYARTLSPDVTALLVDVYPDQTKSIQEKWDRWGDDIRLEILPSPYRSLIGPIHTYLDQLEAESQPQDALTVVLPQFVTARWWENFLHNQTALMLRLSLILRRGTVVTDVPYQLRSQTRNPKKKK